MVTTTHWNRSLVDPTTQAPMINAIKLHPCGHCLNFTSVGSRQVTLTVTRKQIDAQGFQSLIGPRFHCYGVRFDGDNEILTLTEYLVCPLDGREITAITDEEETRTAVREQLYADHHPTSSSLAIAAIRNLYASFSNWMFGSAQPPEVHYVDLR
jgi:hypothetical protein